MKTILAILILISILALSGCIESEQKTFDVISPTEGLLGIWQKFTISDKDTAGNVSYKVCWDDGTCTNTRPLPRDAVVPMKHAWFIGGNYTVQITATYDDGSTRSMERDIYIKE